ncbi:MAG TPA: peptide chain release factor N(5)-glutamine methyltransferase [Dictyoglomaceae bacterium]|nr:peptide chain release factor N(5)-glutamine methyltransferase [Dictyoglomaceae bacterium]HOL39731.1 peptide chain release factor N(5)-glutamine methyltransferase [Dictyoglomaceae bacterium]HOP95455.1 peptide chain release factor N(5)-glutamine methyltransferase [Dictyoglomaceae bacterium]HPP16136.1 peptide chain release factor N(5)-glutamine methyltransferase [Dictyoglomaceae bacterium]
MQPLREVLLWVRKELEDIDKDSAWLESELLVSFVLNKDRADIYTVDYLSHKQILQLKKLVKLRKQRYPLSYILQKKYFYDAEFLVKKGVLVPRDETELIVDVSIDTIKDFSIKKVLDIGTGSGNIAISIVKALPYLEAYACDISPLSLNLAKINAKRNGVYEKIKFLLGPLLYPVYLRNYDFDLIVSNPPYIASREMPFLQEEVKREPWEALYGGWDGCEFYREIFTILKNFKKGIFIFELSPFIIEKIKFLIEENFMGYRIDLYKDLLGNERVVRLIWGYI